MANVEINDITLKGTPVGTDECELQETGGGTSKKFTIQSLWDEMPQATQGEAEAGTENTKQMTSLRTAQAIAALETPAPAGQWELFKTYAITSDDTDPWGLDGLDLDTDEEYFVVTRFVRSEFGASFDFHFYFNSDNSSGNYDYKISTNRAAFGVVNNGQNTIVQNGAETFDAYGSYDTYHITKGSDQDAIWFTRIKGQDPGITEYICQYEGTENLTTLTINTEGAGLDIGSKAWVYRRRQTL